MRTLITKILKRLSRGAQSPGWSQALLHRLLWALVVVPMAAWGDVRLVLSDTSPHYQQIAEDIDLYLEKFHPDVEYSLSLAEEMSDIDNAEDLIIAIGTKAAETSATQFPGNPALYLFITHNSWSELKGDGHNRAAIIIDQPAERYLKLAKLIAPDAQVLGTVYGPISANQRDRFQAIAFELEFELAFDSISRESNPLEVISPIFDQCDIFVALPDEALINRNLAQWALHLGFKKQIPIIGFSNSYTKAGALASIFTSPENVSRQSLEWINGYLRQADTSTWKALSPEYFTITINNRVMNALGLRLDASQLMVDLSRSENLSSP